VTPAARAAAVLAVVVLSAILAAPARAQDWHINLFESQIEIQPDGRLVVNESVDLDFGALERRGILRDLRVRFDWPLGERKQRYYQVQVISVTDGIGRALRYETSDEEAMYRIRIGDPDRTVSGPQQYRIRYTVQGALNGFPDHDELYWNVVGDQWEVPITRATATVRAPAGFSQIICYVGPVGSTDRCGSAQANANGATFTAGRTIVPGSDFTIVTALRKGVVPDPVPLLQDRPRGIEEFFDLTPLWLALAAVVAAGGLVLVFWRWYTAGRDDRAHETIIPEYEPPEKLRPAQIGLLVDERADTLDVTATIVDLAVRGYLTITEVPKEGLFGSADYLLTRKKTSLGELEPYERVIMDGLFASGDQVTLSSLKKNFYTSLAKAQSELYLDSVKRGWFPIDPARTRATYAAIGVAFIVLAGVATAGLGFLFGGGVVGLAAGVPAMALIAASPVMPAKTRSGAQLERASLGFKNYMEVAEKDRQRFAEKEHIFAEYLPYAIVFRCVDKWAKAFEGIDLKEVTSSWYNGSTLHGLAAANLSRDLSSFSSQISTAIAATPGGSGSSGFGGGGGSGGGGGGGGGGSW
jgi:uncharacterized membrane protein YgcG